MYIYILHAKPPIRLPTSVRSMLAVNKQMSFFNYCEKKTNYMYVTIVRQFYSLRERSGSTILRRLNGPTVLYSDDSMVRQF